MPVQLCLLYMVSFSLFGLVVAFCWIVGEESMFKGVRLCMCVFVIFPLGVRQPLGPTWEPPSRGVLVARPPPRLEMPPLLCSTEGWR